MSVTHLGPPARKQATGSHYHSTAYEEKPLVHAGRGIFSGLCCTNKNASKVYLFVCDLATASGMSLANTILPPIEVDATDGFRAFEALYGVPFTNGLVVAASSTVATYTGLGSNDINIQVDYAVDTTSPTTDP